jgi:hypothetical protein
MITIFYTFLLTFICNKFYYLVNKHRLSLNFKNKDIKSTTKLDVIYYITELLYWIWLIFGIFSSLSTYFIILLILGVIKFITFRIKRKSIYVIFDNIFPILSVFFLVVILLIKFTS